MSEPVVNHPAAQRLPGLDWIRGAAALWVLFYHVDITLQKSKYFGLPPLSLITSVGYRGVELFFLLSGFVMARMYDARSHRSWNDAAAFGSRRLLRILPAYLVVFLPLFTLAAWKGVGAPLTAPVDMQLFLWNAFLLPRDDLTTYIPVSAWTLTHELMFYALFLFAFVSWRLFVALISLWAALCLVCVVFGIKLENWQMQTSGFNVYFLLGIICSRVAALLRGWRAGLSLLAIACLTLAILLEGGRLAGWGEALVSAQLAYALAFFLVICVFGGEHLRLPKPVERVANYLGRISYGVYLVNYPVVVVVAITGKALGLSNQVTLVSSVAAMALTIVTADVIYRYVERPSIAFGKRLFRRPQ